MHGSCSCTPQSLVKRGGMLGTTLQTRGAGRYTTRLRVHMAKMVAPCVVPTPESIVKPATDTRQYHAMRLDNGARFILVSDPEVVFAAAAVNVHAGYMHDPQEVPGLAHFLEHAVHLGSERFPGSAEYKAYLARNGGNSNASTGMVHTVFHQMVHHNGLEGALERLGQFFTSPLLQEEAISQELEVVHAEYSRNCNSDDRKLLQLCRSVCQGPYSQFSTGNMSTLGEGPAAQGIHVAALLRQYWVQHYTADRICGCVVAPQPLDQLATWVQAAFSGMRPSPTAPLPPHLVPAPPAAPAPDSNGHSQAAPTPSLSAGGVWPVAAAPGAGLNCLLRVSPQREALRELELRWHIPYGSMRDNPVKPWRWVGHLLGHEGRGSLAAGLKELGLITNLSAGIGDEVRSDPGGFMFWGLTLQLTEEGLARVPHLLVSVHHALAVIRAMNEAEREATYKETAQVAELRWQWADRTEARELAKMLATRAHYYPAQTILSAPSLLQCYDGVVVDQFLDQLVPSQLQVVLCAQGAAGPTPAKERWYGARYTQEELAPELVAACTAALAGTTSPSAPILITPPPAPADGAAPQPVSPASQTQAPPNTILLPPLAPPGPNWALPVDTTMCTHHHVTGPGAQQAANLQGAPQPPPSVLIDAPSFRLWHQPDTSWKLPKAHVSFHLISPLVYASPQSWVVSRLLVRLLDDRLQRDVYDAELTGTHYSLSAVETGFTLTLEGFSSVLPHLLRHVLEGLNALAQDNEQLEARYPIMAGKLAQSLSVWQHNSPLQHAEYAAQHLLQVPHWHVNDTLTALLLTPPGQSPASGPVYRPEVGPQAVAALARDLRHHVVEGLCHGNMGVAEALAVAQLVREVLQPQGIATPQQWPQIGMVRLQPPGTSPLEGVPSAAGAGAQGAVLVDYVVTNPNPTNTNSALLYLCQVCDERDPSSVGVSVLLSLLVAIASKPAFHALRTQQKLGYIVSLSQHRHHGIASLQVRIQSPEATPALLTSRLRAWLTGFKDHLAGLSAAQLDEYTSALASRLAEPPRSLDEASGRAWNPIVTRTYAFDRRQEKLTVLKGVGVADLVQFYTQHVAPVEEGGAGVTGAAEGTGLVAPGSRSLVCEVWGSRTSKVADGGAAGSVVLGPVQCVHVEDSHVQQVKSSLGLFAPRPNPLARIPEHVPRWHLPCD